ncbi:MAG: 50S ribosomal protein L9 [Caldiserica bacterium]|nr:MAG: 50S ribosomal protein L9 [Caldisericota bacterium]
MVQNEEVKMEVILRVDIPKLGKRGDIVSVKDGYARNFLIPRGLAYPKTEENLLRVEKEKKLFEKKKEAEIERLKSLSEKISSISIRIKKKTHDEVKIYGSVTKEEIQEALKKEGIEIDKRSIEIKEPIKELGVYHVDVNLGKDIVAKLKLWVEKEEV